MELNLNLEIEKIKVEGVESERGLYTSYSPCSCVNPPCPIRP